MDYKDRVQFHFEELWGEWKMRESAINQNKDFNENIDNESLHPEELKLLEILEEIGIDSEDKSGKGDFFHTDDELLECLNIDNSINYDKLKAVFKIEAEHRAKDLPVTDLFNKGIKKVAQIPLPTNPKSLAIAAGSGEGIEIGENERYERKKHLLRIFRSKNLHFHPVFIDFDALNDEQKEKYGNMFRTKAPYKRDGDVIHPGQYGVYVVPDKGLTFMVSDKYAEATYVVDHAPSVDDLEDIIKTICFNKAKKDEAEYPVAVINWPLKGTMEEWRKLIENFLDDTSRVSWKYADIKNAVLSAGVKSTLQYTKMSRQNGWPDYRVVKELQGWTDWDSFFERESKKKWTYDSLKKSVNEAGISSSHQYHNNAKKNGWPSSNKIRKILKTSGVNWDEFLKRKVFTYTELKKDVHEKGVTSITDYLNKHNEYGWPVDNTLRKINGWTNWDDFLDRESRPIWTYESLKKAVNESGVTSTIQYRGKAPSNLWPSLQTVKSMIDWNSWDEFFEKK